MNDDQLILSHPCRECGFPISASVTSPTVATSGFLCPYCGKDACTPDDDAGVLHGALYGLPLESLQQLKLSLRTVRGEVTTNGLTAAVAPISQPLATWLVERDEADTASAPATLATIVDVLLTLYVVSEEIAPPDQLGEVIANVLGDRLDQLPLPPRGPCFCSWHKRYKKCHGRAS